MPRASKTTNEQLKDIMAELELTRGDIQLLTCCASKSTVDRWMLPPKIRGLRNIGFRVMPDARMQLLLKALSPTQRMKAQQTIENNVPANTRKKV